jgi:Rad3-related DNA helicase
MHIDNAARYIPSKKGVSGYISLLTQTSREKETKVRLSYEELIDSFPFALYEEIRPGQEAALKHIAKHNGNALLELPTGTGKTDVGYSFLQAVENRGGEGTLFYIVPTKALVDQVHQLHPDMTVAYGRSEYPCHYYEDEYRADEIPCLTLRDCPHRVDMETGATKEVGATPCAYYQAKYEARQSRKVVCTMAFYLYNTMFGGAFEQPPALVIDEVHNIAKVIRNSLSYDITDWHLRRSIELLRRLGADNEADQLDVFLKTMMRVLRRKPQDRQVLLKDEEISQLLAAVAEIDVKAISSRINQAVKQGEVDRKKDREFLRQLESITLNLNRYVRSLGYSLGDDNHHALNYVTYAYSLKEEMSETQRVQYRLIIRAYYVVPLVRKLLGEMTVAYSATIGDPEIFAFESGVRLPFVDIAGNFPVENTLVLMPNDTPNLATKVKIRQEPTKVLRRIARTCYDFQVKGIRSLVIVVSNHEKGKFEMLCSDEGVDLITYGDGVTAREAAASFKAGEGSTLLGTAAHYGEGIDLPEEMAPVIFVLRPSYPSPYDPLAQFEERRFGGKRWQVWNWRVMIEALQVRGRNIRSADDLGATIFISQQFRRFLYGSLPTWLRPAYRCELSLDDCRKEVIELLD